MGGGVAGEREREMGLARELDTERGTEREREREIDSERDTGRARGAVLVCVAALLGCRAPAQRPWLEEEPGQRHVRPASPVVRASAEGELAAALASGDPGAIVIAAARVGAAGGELSGSRTAIEAAIDRATAAELAAAAEVVEGEREPALMIRVRLAKIAAHVGGGTEARVDPGVIAVLLPLTGRYAALGADLRLAIELAPLAGAKRVFFDTRGEAAGASAAVDRAAAAGAIAILGPVGLREAEAAALRAVTLGLPIALLAPGDGADPDAGVFRLVGSPEREAVAAAAIAVALGTPTVGVLAPRDDVGIAASEAFVTAAVAGGLAVTARGHYDSSGTDLEPDVKDFLGLEPATNPRLAAHLRKRGRRGWQSFSPDVPFALLYVPDRHDRAALVASFLPYLGVELRTVDFPDPDVLRRKHGGRIPQVVQLLGSSGWNHPSLPVRGGSAVEGALVVEPCPGLRSTDGGEVAAGFRDRAGREPASAALEAHDAWRLVAAARVAAARAAEPRAAFVAALRGGRLDDGACQSATVAADGQLAREPALLGVESGELVEVPY